MKRWNPGDRIEMREVWDGRDWEIRQGFIVEDTQELLAIYTPPRMPATVATRGGGQRLRLPPPTWDLTLSAVPRNRRFLALHTPGVDHSILAIWDANWRMICWYINLESDAKRIDTGIVYEEHVLDVVVQPDLSSWRWKDEDELEEAIGLGMFTPEQADEFRAEGEMARDWLLARRPPYDRRWEDWRPPAEWRLETLDLTNATG